MPQTKAELIARAEDLQDMLDHIAWTDTVLPELRRRREAYAKILVQSVLGTPFIVGGRVITSEQLAGRIYGIDEITQFMSGVLGGGKRAAAMLANDGLGTSDTNKR